MFTKLNQQNAQCSFLDIYVMLCYNIMYCNMIQTTQHCHQRQKYQIIIH